MQKEKNTGIYNLNNPYGFKLNLNNEKVRAFYNRYKAWKGIAEHTPLSDRERFEFEDYLLNKR